MCHGVGFRIWLHCLQWLGFLQGHDKREWPLEIRAEDGRSQTGVVLPDNTRFSDILTGSFCLSRHKVLFGGAGMRCLLYSCLEYICVRLRVCLGRRCTSLCSCASCMLKKISPAGGRMGAHLHDAARLVLCATTFAADLHPSIVLSAESFSSRSLLNLPYSCPASQEGPCIVFATRLG